MMVQLGRGKLRRMGRRSFLSMTKYGEWEKDRDTMTPQRKKGAMSNRAEETKRQGKAKWTSWWKTSRIDKYLFPFGFSFSYSRVLEFCTFNLSFPVLVYCFCEVFPSLIRGRRNEKSRHSPMENSLTFFTWLATVPFRLCLHISFWYVFVTEEDFLGSFSSINNPVEERMESWVVYR